MDLLARVELDERADAFPDRLSGGEQQRIAIARSLILEPPLLLADEPTGNLDAESGERIAGLLFGLARDRRMTVMLATHSLELAGRTDRIVTLRAGRVASDSRPATPPQHE
jgi:putative ABC transport system ATP-binding protein